MGKPILVSAGVYWLLLISGCPTRTVSWPDGGMGGTAGGGHSGAAGSSTGGAAGAISDGRGGSEGTAGSRGAGGTTGSTGGSAVGGDAGRPAGGQSGSAGELGAGGSGAAGAGGSGAAGQGGVPAIGGTSGGGGASAGGAGGSSPQTKAKDGDHCTLATDCASTVCTPFYVDLDGDGYGAGQAVGFCGTTAPVGYAAQSGDCCDTATNLAVAKLIHPGADFQSTSAGGVCNITWDYDCSGAVEKSWKKCGSCNPAPDCSCVYTDFPDSDCGTTQGGVSCSLVQAGPSESCMLFGGGAGPVTCR